MDKALQSARAKAGGTVEIKRWLRMIGATRRRFDARGSEIVSSDQIARIVGYFVAEWRVLLANNPALEQTDTGRTVIFQLSHGKYFNDMRSSTFAQWLGSVQEKAKTALAQAYATGGIRSTQKEDSFRPSALSLRLRGLMQHAKALQQVEQSLTDLVRVLPEGEAQNAVMDAMVATQKAWRATNRAVDVLGSQRSGGR